MLCWAWRADGQGRSWGGTPGGELSRWRPTASTYLGTSDESDQRSAVARKWLRAMVAQGGGARLWGLGRLARTREESGGDQGTAQRCGRQLCGEGMGGKGEGVWLGG
jgi:hypothetical protein